MAGEASFAFARREYASEKPEKMADPFDKSPAT
jgi:hypothetical protein